MIPFEFVKVKNRSSGLAFAICASVRAARTIKAREEIKWIESRDQIGKRACKAKMKIN
jgi:hypothetical protein